MVNAMTPAQLNAIVGEIDAAIHKVERLIGSFHNDDSTFGFTESSLPPGEREEALVLGASALARIAGRESEFYRRWATKANFRVVESAPSLLGSLKALRTAVQNGWLVGLEERLRANVHDDFLEQANSLIDNNYPVPAMVLIGVVLENHLRALCVTRNLSWTGSGSLNVYNTLLYNQARLYDVARMRRIQQIADLRKGW